MPFPIFGISIAAISLIPGIISNKEGTKLNELKQCKQFPLNSKPSTRGYYWLRGSVNSKNGIKIDINDGNLRLQHNFGIVAYSVDRIIETRHVNKRLIEDKDKKKNKKRINQQGEGTGSDQKEDKKDDHDKAYKEEKYSEWKQTKETMHAAPTKYASLNINNININPFRNLFQLSKQYEIFSDSPTLNSNNNNNGGNNINLSLNIGGGGGSDQILGEKERKTIGYKHKWYGVNIGDEYTIIGFYDGDEFRLGPKLNMVSRKSYYELIQHSESKIWWLRTVCVAGLLISSGVGIYEMKYPFNDKNN